MRRAWWALKRWWLHWEVDEAHEEAAWYHYKIRPLLASIFTAWDEVVEEAARQVSLPPEQPKKEMRH